MAYALYHELHRIFVLGKKGSKEKKRHNVDITNPINKKE